jgi:hypothetical protein
MSLRAPDAEIITVVLVGSFNPAIFHPEWFRRQQILLPAEAEEAKVNFVTADLADVVFLDMKLNVSPDRFTLETKDASRGEKLQDVVINVLTKLPHTPIIACGINSRLLFDLRDQAYWHQIGHTLAPKELIWNDILIRPGMQTLTVKGIREGNFPGKINITVSPHMTSKMPHGLSIHSNYHFPVPPHADGETPRSDLVVAFLHEQWKPALDATRSVANRIFTQIKLPAS